MIVNFCQRRGVGRCVESRGLGLGADVGVAVGVAVGVDVGVAVGVGVGVRGRCRSGSRRI